MDDKTKRVFKSLMMVTQIGISMMVPIFVSGAIGIWLNRLFHTDYAFLIMIFIGIGSAFRSTYILTKGFYQKDLEKERAETDYIEGLKEEGYKKAKENEESEKSKE